MDNTTLQGKLCTAVEEKHTTNGKTCYKFSITSKTEPIECIAWQHYLDKKVNPIRLIDATAGEKITVTGFWGTKQQKRNQKDLFNKKPADTQEKEFVVKAFWFDGDKPVVKRISKRERIKELVDYKSFREFHEEKIAQGKVRIQIDDETWMYANASECIEHKGKWKRKIQYCMDVLGVDYVNRILKESGTNGAIAGFYIPKYKEILNSLIKEARETEHSDEWGDSDYIF